jgi:hypothetical protein
VSDFARHAPDHLLTLDQVAVMARADKAVVDKAVRDRKLAARQVRGEWMVQVADVRRWLSRR